MADQHHSDESGEHYDYSKLLRRREWREKSGELKAKSPRCEKCGRKGGPLAVHHRWYEYGRLPWEYPDEAYMIVCSGRCHREADREREEQKKDAENHRMYGWQAGLAKKTRPLKGKELRLFENHKLEFNAWLIRHEILREPWDWNTKPLWFLWNQLSDEFFAEGNE